MLEFRCLARVACRASAPVLSTRAQLAGLPYQKLRPRIWSQPQLPRAASHAAAKPAPKTASISDLSPPSRLSVDVDGKGVAIITLQDHKTRNCLSTDMMNEIIATLEGLEAKSDVKVVVLTHSGKVFSSGHNLKELQISQETTGETHAIFNTCNRLMLKVRSSRLPIIASVSGFSTAAGCQLVAMADVCIASESASFSTPGVNIGLFCHTPAVALGRAVGPKLAMSMLLTGEIISAFQAQMAGLVTEVVPDAHIADRTRQVADKIAMAPSAVISLGKATFYKQMEQSDIEKAYTIAGDVMAKNMTYPDAKEGIDAFINKRPPQWKS